MKSLKIFKTERWATAGGNSPLPNIVGLLLAFEIYQSLIGKIMIVSLWVEGRIEGQNAVGLNFMRSRLLKLILWASLKLAGITHHLCDLAGANQGLQNGFQ